MSRLKQAWRRRSAKWRAGWVHDLTSPGARASAYFDMNWLDHGALRKLWSNRHEIAPGVWRSNQPSPEQIADLAAIGIRTIMNFRGPSDWGSYVLEKEACDAHGITLINARLYSSVAPSKELILQVIDVFETAERPLLMHCKSGADRAGLGAAIYLLWSGAAPQAAADQLSLKYLHVKRSKTGILDAFIDAYAQAHAARGTGFMEWLENDYDPDRLSTEYRPARVTGRLVDMVLRRE